MGNEASSNREDTPVDTTDASAAADDKPEAAAKDENSREYTEASCALCQRQFTLFFRRHHCRHCLIAVCNDCGGTMRHLPSLNSDKMVRWCNRCVKLVDEKKGEKNGKDGNKDPPKQSQLAPLPEPEEEHLFLRSVETRLSVVPASMEDDKSAQFFDVSIHWSSQESGHEEISGTLRWVVQHRYSEFAWLDAALRKRLGEHGMSCKLPTKSNIFKTKDDAFLQERAKGLETYCRFLADHAVLCQSLTDMRKLRMQTAFIEAALLVRVFFALSSHKWQEVQTYSPSDEKEKPPMEDILHAVCE